MSALGRVALVPATALTIMLVLAPVLAVVVLGALGLAPVLADHRVMSAAWCGVQDAALGAAEGWTIGVLAAFGIWGGKAVWRRVVLAAAWTVLLVPQALPAHGLGSLAQADSLGMHLAAAAIQTAPIAGLVTLVMTAALNRLDPLVLRSAAASGAAPLQAWRRTVLPALAWPLFLSCAAAFALCLGATQLDALLGHATLGGVLGEAIRQHDVASAPEALLLGGIAMAPLLPLALLAALVRRLA